MSENNRGTFWGELAGVMACVGLMLVVGWSMQMMAGHAGPRRTTVPPARKATDPIATNDDLRRAMVLRMEDEKSMAARAAASKMDLRNGSVPPNGKVIARSIDGCYINLGSRNGLKPGMTFTVFDPRTGVVPNGRGKGSLEVVQVREDLATCRVTGADEAMQAGDLIFNPELAMAQKPIRYVIAGYADIDDNGTSTAEGTQRFVTLFRAWGAEVDDEVGSQTDCLVLLEEPARSHSGTPQARARDQQRYDALKQKAERMGIKILVPTVPYWFRAPAVPDPLLPHDVT